MTPVIVYFQGGVGNQLFQWAYGTYLAGKSYRVAYNDYYMQGLFEPQRFPFELDKLFTLPVRTYSPWTIRALRLIGYRYHRDDPVFVAHPLPRGRALAVGFWQLPLYAQTIRETVRARLPAVSPPAPGEWISLGIRRGDYVSDPKLTAAMGVLGFDYYRRALAEMPSALPIVIMTDDPGWAQAEFVPALGIAGRTRVLPLTLPTWEKISVMRQARHHIIANSTFHWWGAYLSDSDHVIAPKAWCRDYLERCPILPAAWKAV